MDLRWISGSGIEPRDVDELPSLLERDDGFVWLDIPECDDEAQHVLSDVFRFHPHALKDCIAKQHLPKVHTYADHVFLILHDIELEETGAGHLVELDQFVGERYLVTVHGPLGSHVSLDDAMRATSQMRARIEAGRFLPRSPVELGHALVSAMIAHVEGLIPTIADKVAVLERTVVRGERGNPEEIVERLYALRHQLLLIRTAASLSREAYAGRETLASSRVSPERLAIIHDLVDQYQQLTSVCDSEKAFLDQVLDFHQARTVTKMNIAMQRLALIAAILLPISAISGVYGMNVIVNNKTDFPHVGVVLIVMVLIVALMLRWTKRQGWW